MARRDFRDGSRDRSKANDLLEASGLIHSDYLEADLAKLMRDIEDDLNETARRSSKSGPDMPR